ncbi:chloride channel protein [Shigella flexneri]
MGGNVDGWCWRFGSAGAALKRAIRCWRGGRAGSAAAFNAPLAGVPFIIEEMRRSSATTLSPLKRCLPA